VVAATPTRDGADAVLTRCLELLTDARDVHRAAGGLEPMALGICAPGPLDPNTGTLIDPHCGLFVKGSETAVRNVGRAHKPVGADWNRQTKD
jgi:hypothetical protein